MSINVLRLAGKLCYAFFRILFRLILGRRRRDRLVKSGLIDIDGFLHKFRVDRRYGFFKSLGRDHVLIRRNDEILIAHSSELVVTEEVKKAYLKPKRGDVVLDIGAHYGFYSIMASKLVGDEGLVLAFEPEPRNFRHLLRNLEMNRVKNVKAFDIALSNVNGEAKLYRTKLPWGHTIVSKLSEDWIWVKVRRLDDFIGKLKLDRINLIKMDIEGAEVLALEGSKNTLKSFKPKLTIAAYHYPKEFEELFHFFRIEMPFYNIKTNEYGVMNCSPIK